MAQKFSWNKLATPFFALAPMAGISNQPFRLICKQFGVDVLFSEMISSEAIWHGKKSKGNILKTLELIKFSRKERPFIVQIFGSDPEHMAFAAKYIVTGEWARDYLKIVPTPRQSGGTGLRPQVSEKIESIPDGIDINMGCPVRDITKTGAGAALLKNPKLAREIVKAVKKAINIPLSVKTRLGWNDDKNILTFSRMLASSGADALTIHGRTVKQGFVGEADWQKISEIKKSLKISVIGNGGLNSAQDVLSVLIERGEADGTNTMMERFANWRRLNSYNGLDGYMIGRGARGNPWIFQKIKNLKLKIKNLSFRDREKIVLDHAKLVDELQGERGIIELRKHLAWYFTGVANSAKIRAELVKVNNFDDVLNIINGIKTL